MSSSSGSNQSSKKTAIIALAAVALVAAGSAGTYVLTHKKGSESSVAQASPAAGDEAQAAAPKIEIKPGNPVVAKIDGTDIMRADVLNFIQTLPPQTRQMPIEQLFPLALDQVVNTKVIVDNTKGVNLSGDAEVQKQLELAKEQIVRSVYLQKEVQKKVTEDQVKAAYEKYQQEFPKGVQEAKAGHILVKDEGKAKELIKKLNDGADFADLAKENSTDGTAQNGGDLGYIAQAEVVPEFGKAAFAVEPGSYTKEPVKTQFGWHVIKIEEKRERKPADFEQVKPFLEAQLRRDALENMVKEWRGKAKVETFDINGDKIEPAAGQ